MGGRHVVLPAEPGEGAAGLEEGERGAGRGAEIEVTLAGAGLGEGGGAADQGEDVALHGRGDVNAIHVGPQREEFLAAGGRGEHGLLRDLAPALHHGGFLLGAGILDDELEEEAVGLGLGQRVGALLLDGILRGHHEERLGQRVRAAADRHLALLHGLKQRALDLGGGAVDLVGEDEVGEDRAAVRAEGAVLRREDHRADHVARQEVGGELDALELDAEGGAEGLDKQRLGEAGHALEEDVAVGQEGDKQALDDGVLADDGLADFVAQFLGPGGTGDHG